MTQITTLRMQLDAWPGLAMATPNLDKQDSFTDNSSQRFYSSVKSPVTRSRYCLRSQHGFATENGFTDNPAEAIQLVDHETAAQRVLQSGRHDLLPHPVTFQFDGDHWKPVQA